MDLDKAIKERHSVTNFKTTKKPDYKQIISIIEAATKAPLAGNIFTIKYVLVQDKEKIKALAVATQQDFVGKVDYILVVCSDQHELEKMYYERAIPYSRQQAGAAIENIFLKTTELGLATCWVGAFSEETVKRLLKIPDNIIIEALMPIGYELGKTKQKAKPDLDRVLFFEEWKNKVMKPKYLATNSEIQ